MSGAPDGAPPENTRIQPGSVKAGEIEIVEERLVWENEVVRLYDDRVVVPGAEGSGQEEITSFRLGHASTRVDGVIIVPITREHRILLIRQFRHPVRMWLQELPRGGRARGERAADAARRELREEIGREADTLHYLGRVVPDSGQLEGAPHLFAARVGPRGESAREAGEAIGDELSYSWSELRQAAERGRIVDGFTLCAVARLAPHFAGDVFRFRPELGAGDELEGLE